MESVINESESESSRAGVHHYGALQPLLDDESIEEIWINSPQRIYVARRGRSELTNLILTKSQFTNEVDVAVSSRYL